MQKALPWARVGVPEAFLPVMARLEMEVGVLSSGNFRGEAATLQPVMAMQTTKTAGEERRRKSKPHYKHEPHFPFMSWKHEIIAPPLRAIGPKDEDANTVSEMRRSPKVCGGLTDKEHPGNRVWHQV